RANCADTIGGRIDLNRRLPDYPPATGGVISDPVGFKLAQDARQLFAREIYQRLLLVTTGMTGSVLPSGVTPGTPRFNALRWLAQLAVNIVDYIDSDDYITPFNWITEMPWGKKHWVYGTELPRLVVNEAYAEYTNNANEPNGTNGKATQPPSVTVWTEWQNPS